MALAGNAVSREMLVYRRRIVQPNGLHSMASRRENESLVERRKVAEDRDQKLVW